MPKSRLFKQLLYPHVAILIALVPVCAAALTLSMVYLGTNSPISICAYVISFYTLSLWCLRIPKIILAVRHFKNTNKYAVRWREDPHLRVKTSLYAALFWNGVYGAHQIALGIYHRTFWFWSIGIYYFFIALMRFFLMKHTRRYKQREQMLAELAVYRACGWIFLLMNLALSLIVFFMVYWNRTFEHSMVTAIMMAAYTFTALMLAIINVVRYKKYESPVFSASKAISLASALVSILTLETTLITTFGEKDITSLFRKWILGATGAVILLFVVMMALYMIINGTKKLNELKNEKRE